MNRCYLIDDDKIFNLISSKMIERSGWECEVVVFNSAEIALLQLTRDLNHPELIPVLVLLDIRMPDMDGITFLQKLNELPAALIESIKVFMLSSSLDERDIEMAKQFPMVKGFLSKPLSIADLNQIIQN
jgi:two-component system, chemotaxis family, chemotaxis protein CheY